MAPASICSKTVRGQQIEFPRPTLEDGFQRFASIFWLIKGVFKNNTSKMKEVSSSSRFQPLEKVSSKRSDGIWFFRHPILIKL